MEGKGVSVGSAVLEMMAFFGDRLLFRANIGVLEHAFQLIVLPCGQGPKGVHSQTPLPLKCATGFHCRLFIHFLV